MSDTTRTILWVVLAIVIIVAIAWSIRSTRKRRELVERRLQAGDLRAQAQEKEPLVQQLDDRASVTEAIAADARAEADERAAAARTLEDQAESLRAKADDVKAEHDELAYEADRVDPDVETDDAEHGAAPASGRPIAPVAGLGVGAVGSTGVLGGASALDHDDEPDLADADDPFAETREESERVGTPADSGYDNPMSDDSRPRGAPEPRDPKTKQAMDQSEPSDERDAGKSEPTAEQSDPVTDDAARDHAVTADAGPLDDATDAVEGLDAVEEKPDRGQQAGPDEDDPPATTTDSPVEDGRQQGDPTSDSGHASTDEVLVPALDERDEVLVAGGPPHNDPGDHRGQPWATTPGAPGPDEGTDLDDDDSDDGFAAHPPADAAPDTDDDAVAGDGEDAAAEAGATGGSPDQDGHSATDTDTDADTTDDADTDDADTKSASAEGAAESSTAEGRRISGFDEVVDGGFGMGSAKPIDDGAQPLGHPVKAWADRKSFVGPNDEGYEGSEPDVWFYNEDAAQRAGFTRHGR